ncbi:cytochrome c3 family protein [Aggregatilinea lenta]|uniref:cytochrome c3 family protein n=1 Tax=Aggregatilinea lenta TaxID=913108 RepID=UPI000E5B9970|nr:cytochrome c3 family protein [Aggregatilinea lenta]
MARHLYKVLLVLGAALLLLAFGALSASGQGDEPPITTSATNVVGVGNYVAAMAYAVPAGEDPAAEPAQALIFPFGVYPLMDVQSIDDFQQPDSPVEGFSWEWSLEAPEGSAAELVTGNVAIFLADVEGDYLLTLNATDESGTTATTTWTVHATTYVGNGGSEGLEPDFDQCAFCHVDQADAWSETGHATIFTRAINGELGPQIGEEALSHFTTGYNTSEAANNGGFDDIARDAGWTMPETLEEGNWEAMINDFPEVADMANVQCEACHGPGNLHVNLATPQDDPLISLGMSAGTCAQCHASSTEHNTVVQWEQSAHADLNAQAFWYPIGEDHAACVRCHSGVGYIDFVSGVEQEEARTDYQVITCSVCHDPHDAENPNQLRVFDSVVLPDGTDVTDAGPAATCMTCHNARTVPENSVEGENFSVPHYSTAAELMNGTGGYDWGEVLPSSLHGDIVPDTCIGCHMSAVLEEQPANAEGVTEDHMMGGHTFSMVAEDGTENVAVCQTCHEGVESFAFESLDDYDGDGTVETNQEEVAGLLDALTAALQDAGVEVLDHHPYFTLPEDASVDLKGAVYNLKFARDDASTIHNMLYTVSLLQLSYEKVTGEPVPDAVLVAP